MNTTKTSSIARVIRANRFAKECCEMVLECPGIAASAKPGQFVQMKAWEGSQPLLRRPISIAGVVDGSSLLLWIRIVGPGSRLITSKLPGDEIELIGPLGNGFKPPAKNEKVWMVAGTLGAAPLRFYSQLYGAGAECRFFYGGAASCDMEVVEDAEICRMNVYATTEDGSAGQKGLVTDILKPALDESPPDRIITCGPKGMMKAIAALAAAAGTKCDVSLDCFMACGFGACMGCAVPILDDGVKRYLHACSDGPVFDSAVIDWEAL
ncbi:MAG TPA: dihydroorotate dehydrogenase electron transfer subunit [bacterium]|nr:dihydroorotate dehydrogenase electron transfer subunit [bacterium]